MALWKNRSTFIETTDYMSLKFAYKCTNNWISLYRIYGRNLRSAWDAGNVLAGKDFELIVIAIGTTGS